MENQSWGISKLRGRDMVKWHPFASMPEQFAGIREILDDLNKVPRAIVSEDMQKLLNEVLFIRCKIKKKYLFHTIVTEWHKKLG